MRGSLRRGRQMIRLARARNRLRWWVRERVPCWWPLLRSNKHRWEAREIGSLVTAKDGTTLTITGLTGRTSAGELIVGAEFCPDCYSVRMVTGMPQTAAEKLGYSMVDSDPAEETKK